MSLEATGRWLYAAVTLLVIGVDRASKAVVEVWLAPHRSLPVVEGFFDLTYVRNPGGVFGVLKELGESARSVIFTLVPAAAILLILIYALRSPAAHRMTQSSLALILGGAIGNLIDRIRYGYVIDFLDFHVGGYHWPAFNAADSAICVGVGLLMLETLRGQGSERADPTARPDGAGAAQSPRPIAPGGTPAAGDESR